MPNDAHKCSPLRDVAGMLRSFSYAALTGLGVAAHTRPEDVERLAPWARALGSVGQRGVPARLSCGDATDRHCLPRDPDDFDTLLRGFVVDKALYELGYELNNRPDWVHIPLTGLLQSAVAASRVSRASCTASGCRTLRACTASG